MYFPYLRGRQFELIALRELLESERIGQEIIPIIEPVKPSATLLKTLECFVNHDREIAVVFNPAVGDFTNVLKQKKKVIAHVVNEFQRVYKAKDENVEYEKELNAELAKLQKTRQKYMDMYTDDLISREELNEKIGGSRQEMERIENELKMVSYHLTKGEQLENILNNTFKEIEDITDVHQMTNQQLKRLIQKIEVDKDGNVDIYLRLLGDLGLDESVLIDENETVQKCNNQT